MAVLKNIILAASLLAPLAAAAPMLDERAILTHTQTEIVWVTFEETTTVWVDHLPTETPEAPAPATPTAATTEVPAFIGAPAPSTFATVAVPASTAPAAAAPSAPAPQGVNVQPKDVASASGSCEGSGAPCVGDVTHWDGGLGACGWDVDSASQMAVALPVGFMGSQSNGNPYCGRSVTLFNPASGTTVQATVGDKCMGCVDRAIDCTNALFAAITDGQGDGRMAGIEWWLD